MKKILGLVTLAFVCQIGFGQLYDRAIGLRGGNLVGLSYKMFPAENLAYEGIFSLGNFQGEGYLSATGLYERHAMAFGVEQMTWHYGAGLRAFALESFGISAGIAGVIGLDYTITEIPFTFSLNWIPDIGIIGNTGNLYIGDAAFSVRYIIP